MLPKTAVLALALPLVLAAPIPAQERVPGERWLRYADPTEAGFDPARLAAAEATWEALPSSAFVVVADGAVVAAWGDLERRFMCHSVRKSFLSALYGVYWDRGELELNKTLADLGLDDHPDPLLESEKRARILDLLKARSGVFHPAAYAGRTDSRPRGSEGPGRYFAYNNWDFNTLAAILEVETGARVFEAFDEHFGRPLGMQDWRVSDGYYHYERDKSQYPAYPFRMSARDAARFGLLFAREGRWGDETILSRHWVRRSTALYSIDSDVMGYGFMWWVFLEPRFEPHGMVSALGVGNQMIAALPDSDLVIVNRANTFEGEGTPMGPLLGLIEEVLAARTGEPVSAPRLVPLEDGPPDPRVTRVPVDELEAYVGTWDDPPAPLGLPKRTVLQVAADDGCVSVFLPYAGTFRAYLQPDGSFHAEDAHRTYYPVRDAAGAFAGLADANALVSGALVAAGRGDETRAEELLAWVTAAEGAHVELGRALVAFLRGDAERAEREVRAIGARVGPREVEDRVNAMGYGLLQAGQLESARDVLELNTTLFPEAFNAWDSLAEAHMRLGNHAEALELYQRSLELNTGNDNARVMMARIREAAGEKP